MRYPRLIGGTDIAAEDIILYILIEHADFKLERSAPLRKVRLVDLAVSMTSGLLGSLRDPERSYAAKPTS